MKHIDKIRSQLVNELTGVSIEDTLIKTPVRFSLQVEEKAVEGKCTLLEALANIVEEHSLEPEQIAKFLTEGLKEKIGLESGIYHARQPLPGFEKLY